MLEPRKPAVKRQQSNKLNFSVRGCLFILNPVQKSMVKVRTSTHILAHQVVRLWPGSLQYTICKTMQNLNQKTPWFLNLLVRLQYHTTCKLTPSTVASQCDTRGFTDEIKDTRIRINPLWWPIAAAVLNFALIASPPLFASTVFIIEKTMSGKVRRLRSKACTRTFSRTVNTDTHTP